MFGHSMFGVFEVRYFGVRSKTRSHQFPTLALSLVLEIDVTSELAYMFRLNQKSLTCLDCRYSDKQYTAPFSSVDVFTLDSDTLE